MGDIVSLLGGGTPGARGASTSRGGIVPKIKWDKSDVIAKFQEAVTSGLSQSKPGQRPGGIQALLDKAKKIPSKLGIGEQRV